MSKVKREMMMACLSCPLCDNILRDATTISECLHTFCRICIYEKITEDEIESCPVCNIDLGVTPLDKLRPDHNLQDLRARIFPLKQRKVKAFEIVSLPSRRSKEISTSSFVVTTPRVSPKAEKTRRRTIAAKRQDSRGSGSFSERTVKKQEFFGDELLENKTLPNTKKSFSNEENKCSASQGSGSKPEHVNAPHNQFKGKKIKTKDQKSKYKREDVKTNSGDPTTSETAMPRTKRKRSATMFGDSRNSPHPDESSEKQERRNGPVWFSLVASSDQEGQPSLPQIPTNFLRIRDGNIPVSFIQKYLMRKLDLKSETEIDIRCMGEVVNPVLKLQKLVDLWLQKSSKHRRFAASVGSSAKDYMMVLVYAPKLPQCNK
ncbi:unnamed protein product [Cochlearia groenlandica]